MCRRAAKTPRKTKKTASGSTVGVRKTKKTGVARRTLKTHHTRHVSCAPIRHRSR